MDMFPSVSRWTNPTDKIVRLDLCVRAHAEKGDGRLKLEIWPAGATMPKDSKFRGMHEFDRDGNVVCARIASEYDAGIHILNADGMVVGGLAPQLRKLDEDGVVQVPEVAPELDPLETAKKQELEKATIALAQKEAAERALIVSGAKAADLAAQQEAQSGKAGKKGSGN